MVKNNIVLIRKAFHLSSEMALFDEASLLRDVRSGSVDENF